MAWLAFLAPFFFASYNLANGWAAAQEPHVPTIAFDWERHIPFLAWTILPYWSSDLLYGLSFWACRTKGEIDHHGVRLAAIQLVSVCIFALFPLKNTHIVPHFDAIWAPLYTTLYTFDQPYNQAPSLHVSLAYLLWRQIRGPWAAAWLALVALSTLTTWQHHFIDLPTGLWAGVLVAALLPDQTRPECRRPKLACFYGVAAIGLTVAGFHGYWILLWPAFSFSLVAAAYVTGNVELLGKKGGRTPVWMWPYNVLAWLNARAWRTGQSQITPDITIGCAPLWKREREGYRAVVDLTAELPLRADAHVPMLDLALPSVQQIENAVLAITNTGLRPVLVCCALGYSRSALAAAAWLYASGQARSTAEAVDRVRAARPGVRISAGAEQRLAEWAGNRNAG
ncbi:MAG TPA: hypothetical protein VFQ91_09105 [Bryobacteraceae bacterium]|nr:hypothetical protein [Bryobacteraceae bacterium]